MLERAVDRCIITKKSFILELTGRLFELPQVQNGLQRLDVDPKAFKAKLDTLMQDPAAPPGKAYADVMTPLAARAFASAAGAGHEFITPSDLFSALPAMADESLDRLFSLFNIEEGDLERALIFSALATRSGLLAASGRGGRIRDGDPPRDPASHHEPRVDIAPDAGARQVWH